MGICDARAYVSGVRARWTMTERTADVMDGQEQMTASVEDLALDIQVAAGSEVPVLISGAPERTVAVARIIVARGARLRRAGPPPFDRTSDLESITAISATNKVYGGSTVLLPEVQTLRWDEQMALANVLSRSVRRVRIIATTSVDLFERMMIGRFDRTLYWRLNTIHIILPFTAPSTTESRPSAGAST
jgi:hypothetical protein